MGGARKPFLGLLGRPVLAWTLDPFLAHPRVRSVTVALASADAATPPTWLAELLPHVKVVAGGDTRMRSVANGLASLPAEVSVVLVHDGARPLVRTEWIDACIEAAEGGAGAVVGYPAVDSMKRVDAEGFIIHTEDRTGLWQVQTPQGFPRSVLEEAYRLALESGDTATDDAQLVERLGCPIRLVPGGSENLKITYSSDLAFAEAALKQGREPTPPASDAVP